MTEMTPEALAERLYGGAATPLVLDVRPADEFEDWHVPTSRNLELYDDLREDPAAARAALSRLPAGREIVTVCAAGVVSRQATDLLRELGHDAKTLVDGLAGWSRLHRAAPVDVAIDGTLVQVARPGKGCLGYVLVSDGEAAVFDPSQYPEEYERPVADRDAEVVGVFDTHAHADHVSGGRALADRIDVPYHLHRADARAVEAEPVADGETFAVGDVEVAVVHTPGHSPGGVTYAVGTGRGGPRALLTGDTLFHESVGRVELGVAAGLEDVDAEANAARLYESIRRLEDRSAADTLVLPAHDPGSPDPPVAASWSEVARRNPDLGRDRAAFVADLATDLPDHPPNFERVKRINVGEQSVGDEERASLELGPNRCAAE